MRDIRDPIPCPECRDPMRCVADQTWRCSSCGYLAIEPLRRPFLPVSLTEIRFTAGTDREQATGLVAYVDAVMNGTLALHGMTIRRSILGKLYVAFPRKGDGRFVIRPVDARGRRELERQILAALDRELAR